MRFHNLMLAAWLSLAASGMATASARAQSAPCQFVLGFRDLHELVPAEIGDCQDDEAFAPNGDAQQHTANGLMAWRKADNRTAFTNGRTTWINGPEGVVSRLNTDRFLWEGDANSDGNAPAYALPSGHEADPIGRPITRSGELPGGTAPGLRVPPAAADKCNDGGDGVAANHQACGARKFDSLVPSLWAADSEEMTGPEYQFLDDLNADRDANGLPALAANGVLAGIARQRSEQLAGTGIFTHYAPDGSLVFANMLNSAAFPYAFAGENLASNNDAWDQSVDGANTQLMHSPEHRAAILNTLFNEVGVGIAGPDDRGNFFYTQIFAQV